MSAIGMPGMLLALMALAGGPDPVNGIIFVLLNAHTISLGMY
ncbi:hypothetical protein MNBD_ALPHA07-805 [hydrothermal vent metagenome]|uniref:Uncharacterized protein n=1 Tax=hydrothermal vent metagenome TaxID=652676 RepID=A0A3B0T3B6_9ZZZZ